MFLKEFCIHVIDWFTEATKYGIVYKRDFLPRKDKKMQAAYDVYDIVYWLRLRNRVAEDSEDADKLTLMKLLKLLYYAEGCYLAIHDGQRLFGNPIMAWAHGPVVVDVYETYKKDPYNLPQLTDDQIDKANRIKEEDKILLEQVFEEFGQYSAWKLRNMTHEETPWLEATDNGQHLNREINQETMKQYFSDNYIEP
ncbi:MAG: Panacea domain-containing protein [Candidatus Weimeria sp.]